MNTQRIRIDVSERELENDLMYGRRRGAALDQPVLDAAIEVLVDEGLAATSIEAVARKRGMGKSTIYRRFANREALVAAAVARYVGEHVTLPDTGSLRADLAQVLDEAVVLLQSPKAMAVAPELIAAANREQEWASALRTRFVQPYQDVLAEAIERAVLRGEVGADVDAELVFDALIGAIAYRTFVTRRPLPDDYANTLISAVLDGVALH